MTATREPIVAPPPLGLPPGPRASPVWQLLRYAHAPLPFLEGCGRRFGDPFTVRLAGYGTLVMLSDPAAVKDVFRGDPDALHSGEGNEFLSVAVGPSSVLVLDGREHAEQRRMLMPPLKGERMGALSAAMQAETADCMRGWTGGQRLRLLPLMRKITLRVILRAVAGLAPGPELDALEAEVERMSAATRTNRYSIVLVKLAPPRVFAGSRVVPFFRRLRELDASLHGLIARRRGEAAGARPPNVLDDLLSSRHADGRPLSDGEVRDAIVTLVVAGFDTTSIALAWALEQILPRADVVARIRAELATGRLDRLEYLDAAIKEALRVRTILPFVVRMTKRPFSAGGRDYPAGVMLAPCAHLVHRRPDLYSEPERFRPERFLERKFAAHEWLPFGGGSRVCLGMTFALHEMKAVLATLLSGAELRPAPGARSRPVRQGISLAPHDGVLAVVG
jgi:cytochrome P450